MSHTPVVIFLWPRVRGRRASGLVCRVRVEGGRREVADAKDGVDSWSSASGCVPFLLVGVMLRRAEALPEGRVLEPRHVLVVGFLLLALIPETASA